MMAANWHSLTQLRGMAGNQDILVGKGKVSETLLLRLATPLAN
jgi:hypothetical protein